MARIILAEDDEIVAEIVSTTLLAAGHAVGWLENGDAALRVMRQRPPNLAILDCNMPEISGILVLRAMRQSQLLCNIPVIMLTARAGLSDEQIARYGGADDYVTKPFDPRLLVAHVEALLAGRRDAI